MTVEEIDCRRLRTADFVATDFAPDSSVIVGASTTANTRCLRTGDISMPTPMRTTSSSAIELARRPIVAPERRCDEVTDARSTLTKVYCPTHAMIATVWRHEPKPSTQDVETSNGKDEAQDTVEQT